MALSSILVYVVGIPCDFLNVLKIIGVLLNMNIYTNAINKCRSEIIRDIHGDIIETLLEKHVLVNENVLEINRLVSMRMVI